MEFKKKTIIWEDNNEPPKDYIWAKKDGKFYEYSYATRSWVESKLINAEESEDSGEVDYETIYQFYRKAILESIPEEFLQGAVIPEHLEEVERGNGDNYEDGTLGIWKSRILPMEGEVLFCCLDEGGATDNCIYVGQYTLGGEI